VKQQFLSKRCFREVLISLRKFLKLQSKLPALFLQASEEAIHSIYCIVFFLCHARPRCFVRHEKIYQLSAHCTVHSAVVADSSDYFARHLKSSYNHFLKNQFKISFSYFFKNQLAVQNTQRQIIKVSCSKKYYILIGIKTQLSDRGTFKIESWDF